MSGSVGSGGPGVARDAPTPGSAAWASSHRGVRRATVAVGLLMTAGIIAAHVEYYRHAGPLWRDEVNSVNIAGLPALADVFAKIPFDSFPAAWLPVLHSWMAVGLGGTDAGLRQLGLLIGMAILAVAWWSSRRLGVAAPLVTLLLLGMSPTTIVYGDEVRGYGLAILGIVWCTGAIWALVEAPGWRTFVIAQVASLLAVQTHFGNCFLLLAIGCGAASVAVRQRATRTLGAIVALGAIAAASMLIDLHALTYSRSLWPFLQEEFSFAWLSDVFLHALAPGVPLLSALWAVAALLAAVGCGLALAATPRTEASNRALFAAVTSVAALMTYYVAVKYVARLRTEYWYYLPLMALLALACEVGIDTLARRLRGGALLRIAAIGLSAGLAAPAVHAAVRLRMTNLDVVAEVLERDARPTDLVVVIPWYCGISFQRYYHGTAPWITVPDLAAHDLHLHLEVVEKMKQGDAGVAPELARVEQTLAQGGRVWLVGMPLIPRPGESAPSLPPAPNGPQGWQVGPYLEGWQLQLGDRLRTHGQQFWHVPVPDRGAVNIHEDLPLSLVEGAH